MAGGYPVGLQWSAIQSSPPPAIILTAGGSTNTLGSYTQLIASTSRDSSWMLVRLHDSFAIAAIISSAVNIATGAAASEIVQVANLTINRVVIGGQTNQSSLYLFPIFIPAGSRIAANMQSTNASETVTCAISLFDDAFASAPGGDVIDTYGFNAATTVGTQIDPGASANTKGAYAQITSSLTSDLAGFFFSIDCAGQTSGSVIYEASLDVAIGAAASEQIILPDYQFTMIETSSRREFTPQASPYFPIQIPAGSRVAIRAQANGANSPSRLFGVTFYGVRL